MCQSFGQHFEVLGEEYATNFYEKKILTGDTLHFNNLPSQSACFDILREAFVAFIRVPCYFLAGITTCWGTATVNRLIFLSTVPLT